MEDQKYRATIIAAISHATVTSVVFVTWIFVAPVTLLLTAFIEPFGEFFFDAKDHFSRGVFTLVWLFILLVIACFWYYKRLMKAKQENKKFNQKELIVFIAVLQFIVHPLGCYIWIFPFIDPNSGGGPDPITMAAYNISVTIPISGIVIIILGLVIDLLWNRKSKGREN